MNKKNGFSDIAERIEEIISSWEVTLLQLPIEVRTERKNLQGRSIKQILGHMIDSASNNHQRIVRLQYSPKLEFPDYRQDNDDWINIQCYQQEDWNLMIKLWKYYNLHIAHLFLNIDEESLQNSWTDFEGTEVTLHEMIEGYLVHFELHLMEIRDVIDSK